MKILSTTSAPPIVPEAEWRAILTKAFFGIVRHWGLTNEQEAQLLGWSYTNKRTKIDSLKRGTSAIDPDDDKLRRMEGIVNIHKNLRILFPYQQELAYGWVKEKRERFGNHSALDVMLAHGLLGIIAVGNYLGHARNT